MTIIVATPDRMVADTQVTDRWGDYHHTPKIFRYRNTIVGAAGDSSPAAKYLNWWEGGCNGRPPGLKKAEGIVLNEKGIFTHYYKHGMEIVLTPYYAIGVGKQLATYMLSKGATPEEAVLEVCEINAMCGVSDDGPTVIEL